MMLLFGLAMLLSAALLFVVELMFARMVLPLLGGSPAVWITCVMFFQAALLAGYVYAHIARSWLSLRRLVPLQLVVLALPLIVLPVAVGQGWDPPRQANPVLWLLMLLTVCVGPPFFAASTISPMIQSWFASTSHRQAKDPYFLYAASNFGSAAGLIGYLVLIEPYLTLHQQSRYWAWAYGLLIALIAACGVLALRSESPANSGREAPEAVEPLRRICFSRKLRWAALAFVPSSLMLGLTAYLTADIASVPLLWVIPLMLYLVTLVLAFSRRSVVPHAFYVKALPVFALVQLLVLGRYALPGPLLPVFHVVTFFVAAMACHGELAADRPSTIHLTEFYVLIAVGGAVGGAFNALLAPAVFSSVVEYPLVLVAACAVGRPWVPFRARERRSDAFWPVGVGAFTLAVLYVGHVTGLSSTPRISALLLGIVCVACYVAVDRPLRFGLGLGAALVVAGLYLGPGDSLMLQERDFFGVLRVVNDSRLHAHKLYSGTTLHGVQFTAPAKRGEPLSYYHRGSPIGQVCRVLEGQGRLRRVALIGLGAGVLAAYAPAGSRWVAYEIDPAVVEIARNPRYFTYLGDADERGAHISIVEGDARLTIRDARDRSFDLIVVDAFSGDSIPVHLLTRDAMRLYFRKLKANGLLAIHISNRYVNLDPILAADAAAEHLALLCRDDARGARPRADAVRQRSKWAVLARSESDLGPLRDDPRWYAPRVVPGTPAWTDDFSNILNALVF